MNTATGVRIGLITLRPNTMLFGNNVALFDQSSFSKFMIQGRDALAIFESDLWGAS